MKSLQQKGAGHLVAILAIVVLLGVGVSGYLVMQAQDKSETEAPATTQGVEAELNESNADLDQAASELDQSLDTAELDKDIDAML